MHLVPAPTLLSRMLKMKYQLQHKLRQTTAKLKLFYDENMLFYLLYIHIHVLCKRMTCCQKPVLSLGSLSQTGLRLSYLPLHEEADRDNLCASLLTWDHASQDYSQGEETSKVKEESL